MNNLVTIPLTAAKHCAESVSEQRLCVKELASSLGVSVRYVYAMRACGFEMDGRPHGQTATHNAAVRWIEREDFKMVDGVGRCANNQNL